MAITEKEFKAIANGNANLKVKDEVYECVGEQQPLGYIFQNVNEDKSIVMDLTQALANPDVTACPLTERQWLEKLNQADVRNAVAFNKADYAVALMQIKPDLPERREIQFCDYNSANKRMKESGGLGPSLYNTVYTETMTQEQFQEISAGMHMEDYLYRKMNMDPPSAEEGYFGSSASISDVVVIKNDKNITALYVENFGYKELDNFKPKTQKKEKVQAEYKE